MARKRKVDKGVQVPTGRYDLLAAYEVWQGAGRKAFELERLAQEQRAVEKRLLRVYVQAIHAGLSSPAPEVREQAESLRKWWAYQEYERELRAETASDKEEAKPS